MGYTHYWYHDHTDPAWPEVYGRTLMDAKRIIEAARCPIVGWDHEPGTQPELSEGRLAFNGQGGDGHESFVLEAQPNWAKATGDEVTLITRMEAKRFAETGTNFTFCKTARKPYDDVVTAVLLRLAHHAADPTIPTNCKVEVSSDGVWSEWIRGRELVSMLFEDGDPDASPPLRTDLVTLSQGVGI